MGMLEIIQLDKKNFNDFRTLLLQRGEAPEDYYRWKYLMQPFNDRPTGLIAYLDGKPVGCIGIINRIYCTAEGKEYPATWFADWFVNDLARGKGIGEMLMQEVRKASSYNFGIPGPLKAQQVCSSAGYSLMPGVQEEVTIYIRPFKCGYFRGNGSQLKRLIRGLKNLLIFFPRILKIQLSSSARYSQNSFLDYNALASYSLTSVNSSNSLKRTKETLVWLSLMPVGATSERKWWTIQGEQFYCWGFFEKDFWGLRKATIFEVVSRQKIDELISVICKTLSKNGIDMLKFLSSADHLRPNVYKYRIPVFYAGSKLPEEFVLSFLDKESVWREFRMN
jgi:hypothetical protein